MKYWEIIADNLKKAGWSLEHWFNNRKNEYFFRDTLTKPVTAKALPYQELVKAA